MGKWCFHGVLMGFNGIYSFFLYLYEQQRWMKLDDIRTPIPSGNSTWPENGP